MPIAAGLGLLVLILAALPAHGASVSGTLLGGDPKAPLLAAEVVLRSAVDSSVVAHASTAADGRFLFGGLAAGRYLLRASLLGYQPLVLADLALADTAAALDLGPRTLALSPIAIRGTTTTTARANAIVAPDRNVYLAKDMPAATSSTATDLLRAVPELDVDLDGRVSLRGSPGVTIQMNGRTSPLKGEALTTFLRQMPASRIERIEVIANPSAKFDPEGNAGIVNLVLKDDVKIGLSGSVSTTIGTRYNGPGARVAWQTGPLTLFGGVAGSWYHYEQETNTDRRSLLTTPASALLWNSQNDWAGVYVFGDLSADLVMGKRATLYGTVNANRARYDPDVLGRFQLVDSTTAVTSRYQRDDDSRGNSAAASFTLGLQHVVEKGRHERTFELLDSRTGSDNHVDGRQLTAQPPSTLERTWRQDGANGYRERALQIDDTRPLGTQLKLETGYRGTRRHTTNSSGVRFFEAGAPVATAQNGATDYEHRETFHSGYVTLGRSFGKLSLQGGVRAEAARGVFETRSSRRAYDHDYRSLFPSANAGWDFGGGRVVRASYSKRIERPSPWYLDPDAPTSDSLNRFVGNPDLGPRYTHSWGIDASWSGSRGTLRLSPYLRRTVDNWDLVTTVDPDGAATTTYRNASSIRTLGVTLTATLRQVGRLGGTASVGVSREHHDASNLGAGFRSDVTAGSANANLTFRTTKALDLQTYLRYAPARSLAQGRASSYTAMNFSARQKFGETASLSLSINDPFHLAKYSSTLGDATYTQTSNSRNQLRGLSLGWNWTWGKAPETKTRKQSADAPPQEGGGPR